MRSQRAQSTVVGALLLVAVAVILAGTVAVLALGFGDGVNQDPITASIQSDVTSREVVVRHAAGDPLPIASTVAIIETDDERVRVPLANLDQSGSGSDDTFTAGETFRIPHDVSDGEIRVKVVEDSRGAVLHDRLYRISDGAVSKIANFQRNTTSDWSGNDNTGGDVTVTDDGRTVLIEGNRWQAIDFSYDVTKDTVISFEFESDAEGEIHGIGFETDTNQEPGRVVRVFGVQGWGVNVTDYGGTYYSTDRGTVTYTVPIGEIYEDNRKLGQANTLLIVNDCDGDEPGADCSASPDSAFRNIQVYERDG